MRARAVKVLAALIIVVGVGANVVADSYPKNLDLDVLHYVFNLTLSDDTDRIEGTTVVQVRFLVRNRVYIELIEVKYGEALAEPEDFVRKVDAFLDHELDTVAMASVVDKQLYRNRGHKLRAEPETPVG